MSLALNNCITYILAKTTFLLQYIYSLRDFSNVCLLCRHDVNRLSLITILKEEYYNVKVMYTIYDKLVVNNVIVGPCNGCFGALVLVMDSYNGELKRKRCQCGCISNGACDIYLLLSLPINQLLFI